MNRVIKFRAWRQRSKEMFYDVTYDPSGWVMLFNDPNAHKEDEGFTMIGSVCHKNKHGANISVNLMQSTGLYDKNGKEIWEGDIMKSKKATTSGIVCFKEFKRYPMIDKEDNVLGWCLQFNLALVIEDKLLEDFDFPLSQGFLNSTEHKVIGNMYENPELLDPIPGSS